MYTLWTVALFYANLVYFVVFYYYIIPYFRTLH
jgi:hypothetical protein